MFPLFDLCSITVVGRGEKLVCCLQATLLLAKELVVQCWISKCLFWCEFDGGYNMGSSPAPYYTESSTAGGMEVGHFMLYSIAV